MRFLLDANPSPKLVLRLRDGGFDATHVAELGLLAASDEEIFERAATDEWVVVTADTDFSMLLALRGAADRTADHAGGGPAQQNSAPRSCRPVATWAWMDHDDPRSTMVAGD